MKGVGCVVRDITIIKRLRYQIREKEHLAALGELSAGMAHEVRNPLGAIQGNAEYLATEIREDELRSIAMEIRKEVQGLERIIRDFLNFARPVPPDVSPIDLMPIIRDEAVRAQQAWGRDVSLHIEGPEAGAVLELDEHLMRQVLKNVFDNACQMMQGRGRLIITVTPPDHEQGRESCLGRDGSAWILRIQDTGPGIPPGQEESVFKPFFSAREGGTGLGLAIVKKIILTHNGFVEFEKHSGSGAHMTITLPETYDPDRTQTFSRDAIDTRLNPEENL